MYNFQPTPNTDLWGDHREVQVWEASKLYGRPVRYMKPTMIKENKIFGESVARNFTDANSYPMMALRDDDTHFSGTESFGGFGLIPQYNDAIHIPVKWFKDLGIDPIEGDVVYYQNEDILFEVSKVMPLTDAYAGDKINERLFNQKLFLKLYHLADDNFNVVAPELVNLANLDDIDLNTLNDDLSDIIESLDIVRPADSANPFAALS